MNNYNEIDIEIIKKLKEKIYDLEYKNSRKNNPLKDSQIIKKIMEMIKEEVD